MKIHRINMYSIDVVVHKSKLKYVNAWIENTGNKHITLHNVMEHKNKISLLVEVDSDEDLDSLKEMYSYLETKGE